MRNNFLQRSLLIGTACALTGIAVASPPPDDIVVEVLEREPSAEFVERIASAFQQATTITVSYTPPDRLGYAIRPKEDITHAWLYQFSFRCAVTCDRNDTEVQRYLSSGLRQDQQCPDPYYAAVTLRGQGDDVLVAYIHSSGRCFTIMNQSYYTPEDFNRLVAPDSLYPGFTKELQRASR